RCDRHVVPDYRSTAAQMRYDAAIDRRALGGCERKRCRCERWRISARLVGWLLVGPRLVIGERLVPWRPRNVSLIDPSLRARRHRHGNEGEREPCGANKRWRGTSCASIEDRWLTPQRAATFL